MDSHRTEQRGLAKEDRGHPGLLAPTHSGLKKRGRTVPLIHPQGGGIIIFLGECKTFFPESLLKGEKVNQLIVRKATGKRIPVRCCLSPQWFQAFGFPQASPH